MEGEADLLALGRLSRIAVERKHLALQNEAQLRLQQRWKKALALAWLAAAILLWLGACPLGRIAQTMFILGGLGCVLVGILLALRRPRADALPRRQVDRARGPLLMFTQRAAGNAAVVNTHALLGDSLKLHLPAHWRNSGRVTSGESVEIEVDRDSGRVLGLGNGWSLEDEQRRLTFEGLAHFTQHTAVKSCDILVCSFTECVQLIRLLDRRRTMSNDMRAQEGE